MEGRRRLELCKSSRSAPTFCARQLQFDAENRGAKANDPVCTFGAPIRGPCQVGSVAGPSIAPEVAQTALFFNTCKPHIVRHAVLLLSWPPEPIWHLDSAL